MAKKLISIRVSDASKAKLGKLAAIYGTQTTVIEIALDRMYRQEIPMPVSIIRVESRPELDPYHRDTGQPTRTTLKVDPQARRAWVLQEYDDNATPSDEWRRIVLAWDLKADDCHSLWPDQEELTELLHGPIGQALLIRICDGHSAEWDGHNTVGMLTDDAEGAAAELLYEVAQIPASEWDIASASDWLHEGADEILARLQAGADLHELAQEYEAMAHADKVVLYGTEDYLDDLHS